MPSYGRRVAYCARSKASCVWIEEMALTADMVEVPEFDRVKKAETHPYPL